MDTLISDLHLSPDQPDLTALFQGFIDTQLRTTERLFILGDLVDAWLGDDDDSAFADLLRAQLLGISQRGTEVYVMHGNRDFLLGPRFASDVGAILIDAPYALAHHQLVIHLHHGDEFCTDDLAYQQFRSQVRQLAWQQAFLAQPLSVRRAFAMQARQQSKMHQQSVADVLMDVNSVVTDAALVESPSKIVVHGHTHRPAIHTGTGLRIVLGDWQPNQPSWLQLEHGKATLQAHGWQRCFALDGSNQC